jgi:hypothetical protein
MKSPPVKPISEVKLDTARGQAGAQQKLQIGEKSSPLHLHLMWENVAAALVMAKGSAAAIRTVGA